MASRRFTAVTEEVVANQSDPDDSDYDNRRSPTKRKRNTVKSSGPRKSQKRARQGYRGGSDIEDDDDEIFSEEEFTDISEDDEPVTLNERTGRPVRRSTQNKTFKEESSDEDIEEFEDDDEDAVVSRRPRGFRQTIEDSEEPEQRDSLIVKLNVRFDPTMNPTAASTRPRRGSRPASSGQPTRPPSAQGQRRSSRQAKDEEETLFSLTDSGRHAQISRVGSRTPEPVMSRATRGGKRMPETSAIIEASQEDSGRTQADFDADLPDVAAEAPPADDNSDDEEAADIIASSVHEEEEEDDSEEGPISKRRRVSRDVTIPVPADTQRSSGRLRKKASDDSSDFAPEPEEPEDEADDASEPSQRPGRARRQSDESSGPRRSTRNRGKNSQTSGQVSDDDEIDFDELAEEAADLRASRKRPRRGRSMLYEEVKRPRLRSRAAQPDYRLFRPELMVAAEEEEDRPNRTHTPQRGRRTVGFTRSLFPTFGPFGGAGGPTPLFSGPGGVAAAGGADSDSSDDDGPPKIPRAIGGAVGMTPTSAGVPQPFMPQTFNQDPAQATSGGPANLGRVKDKKTLADADPLGVDQNVNFDGVGGLDDHINQLKEMVALPLLYPEVFQQFKITPPRGVLFHGPPGTGKTLLARALASSVSQQGRKVTFYMRKGADALSKWVGEAERQLRLLFEEARKNQPSIIFFDEIDGLAPVRSSKQEQIHASIVATLLALMDGMDGRGQVIVIGATNRPDSVDPALRRPGRFDREFYFPLPNDKARRAIIDIHTKGWDPPLAPNFKDQLSKLTKGYGGADLRALCTEAALNAVQGTYPQIYKSNEKLLIDPSKIKVLAKDFMISVNKMTPSSERATTSGAAPLDSSIEPLLRDALNKVSEILDDMLPTKPKLTALEEAEYDDRTDENGFEREMLQQKFDKSRIFRPRLLIYGPQGMGQQYLGGALLNKFERLHVQSFDLSVLYSDTSRSPEAAVVQLFQEVRRHKPSVVYIPNISTWYDTVGPSVVRLLAGQLRSLPPTEPVLVLGIMDLEPNEKSPNPALLRDLFGFTVKSHFQIERITADQRFDYFTNIISNIKMSPSEFPDPATRKKRELPQLKLAPTPTAPTGPSREEVKAQKKADRRTLNHLKIQIQPIMDQINRKYKKFRTPIIDETIISYLFDEQDPAYVRSDVPLDQQDPEVIATRPYELKADEKGVMGLKARDGRFYYNLDIVTIEKRLSNGYYKRPKDFLADIKRLAKDARTAQDEDRTLRANELVANVEVDLQMIEDLNPALVKQCEEVYQREKDREKQAAQQTTPIQNGRRPEGNGQLESSGPVVLGERVPGRQSLPETSSARKPPGDSSSLSNGHVDTSDPHNSSSFSAPVPVEDAHMEDSQISGALTQGQDSQSQRFQASGFMQMAKNSQSADYHNSASTTTSGQKTSDKSSGNPNNTQSTNGTGGPNFDHLNFTGGSELPDTQDMQYPSSQSQSQHSSSQPMGPPQHRHSTSIHDILNKSSDSPAPRLIIDESAVAKLHADIVHRSSGCTVEQLEQLNAAMTDAVWRNRSDWNRSIVLQAVGKAFNDKIADIEFMQTIAKHSQDDPPQGEAQASAAGTTTSGVQYQTVR